MRRTADHEAGLIKILLYGGCHALVLRDLLGGLYGRGEIETSLLINFHLIASGKPFPYDQLDRCDAIVFSPIENKDSYNTDRLTEYCMSHNKMAICFPWMEWHGYCPGAIKGFFKGRFQWFYPELVEIAARFDRLEDFVSHVTAHFPSNEVIDHSLAYTSDRLAATEVRHEMPVRITDFIQANYRLSRLFLISDHPSLLLYRCVLEQIVAQLGLAWPDSALATFPTTEPQWGWRTPIFPRVAERLGLAFEDSDWRDDELIPARTWPLQTYLSLYFHRDSVILGPLDTARLHLEQAVRDNERQLDPRTRIFARPLASDHGTGLESYAYLETLSGCDLALHQNAAFRIDAKLWRSTWDF